MKEQLLNNVEELLEMVYSKYKVDMRNYAPASLERRLERFMKLYNIQDVSELSGKLIAERTYFDFFIKEITVNTTEMFRDIECWKILRQEIIPLLKDLPSIRIWHAGCSSGEEVYSMAILLKELGVYDRVKMVASDINKDIIETAKKGIYPVKHIAVNEENYLNSGGNQSFASYYTIDGSDYKMDSRLLENVRFFNHDLSSGEQFSKFDIILCRNVLIYFNKNLQERVFSLFEKSLFKRGFIVLGKKESMSLYSGSGTFHEYNTSEKIYRIK